MRKLPGSLGLKKFGPGKIWVKNVWTQNTCILAFLHTFILSSGNPQIFGSIFFLSKKFMGPKKSFGTKKKFYGSTKYFGSKK